MSELFAVTVPQENANDEFATVVDWPVNSGEWVEQGDSIVELETSKAVYEINAEKPGYLFYELSAGIRVSIGVTIAYLSEKPERPSELDSNLANTISETEGEIHISSRARKLLNEYDLDALAFKGTSRIRVADVQEYIEEKQLIISKRKEVKHQQLPFEKARVFELSHAKQFEIRQLTESYANVIHSSVTVSVDLQKVEEKLEDLSTEENQITLGELIIHETTKLLKDYELLNGGYLGDTAYLYDHVNIGIAINIGKGLKVPVIRDADQLSLATISHKIKDLSFNYFRDELTPKDLEGGTFTVTDLSSKGVTHFIPVVNYLQSSILGICSPIPGTRTFQMVMSFDHRMADGMIIAEMLNELKESIENPTPG